MALLPLLLLLILGAIVVTLYNKQVTRCPIQSLTITIYGFTSHHEKLNYNTITAITTACNLLPWVTWSRRNVVTSRAVEGPTDTLVKEGLHDLTTWGSDTKTVTTNLRKYRITGHHVDSRVKKKPFNTSCCLNRD